MNRSTQVIILAVAILPVGACTTRADDVGGGDTSGLTPCEAVSTVPMSSLDESEWPEGLSALRDMYDGLSGTWTVQISCDSSSGDPYEGPATIVIQGCGFEEMDISEMEGTWCDGITHETMCTSSLLSISEWGGTDFSADAVSTCTLSDHTAACGIGTLDGIRLDIGKPIDMDMRGTISPVVGSAMYCTITDFVRQDEGLRAAHP